MKGPAGDEHRLAGRLRLALAAIAGLLALAVLFLILRDRPEAPGRKEAPSPPPQAREKLDEKVRIRYVEFRGEREKVEFSADRSYRGADDRYHMVGNVKIVDHGRKGGFRVSISGREVVHDADRLRYEFVGPVTVVFKGLTVRTSDLVYQRRTEMFRTERRVDFESLRLRGGCRGLSYSLRNYDLALEAELAFELQDDASGKPLSLAGRSLVFHQDRRQGEVEGPVSLAHGRSRASCQRLDFELFGQTDQLSIVYLRGDARLALRGEFTARPEDPGVRSLSELGDDLDIEAQEVKLRAFQDSTQLHSFETSGKSSFRFLSASGGWTHFQAEQIGLILDRQGGLREFRSVSEARMVQKDAASDEVRSATGESIVLPGDTEWLQVRVKAGDKARAVMGQTEILADELDFGLKKKDLEARRAKAVLAGRGREQTVGFFEPGVPSFVLAGVMRFFGEERRYFFQGDVRMWQEGKTLSAAEFEYWEESGGAAGRGGVRAVFPHKPKDRDREEKVEVSALRLTSRPEDRVMTFEPGARLHLEKAEVRARSIEVRLREEGRRLEGMSARGDVVILQPGREGRGELAVYDAEKDLLVLTGHPFLIDRQRGRVEGDKLTFNLDDGTITVENTGRERSVTLIKS